MSFTYLDYETVNLPNVGRVYQISDEKYYPSITTMLGHTLEPEKQSVLAAWRKRVGQSEADRISQAAAARGTHVHLMIERALKGEELKLDEFPQDHVNMYRSLRLELKKIGQIYGQEVVLFSDTLKVAGRCDLVGEYNGTLAIVDYKTSTRAKTAYEIGDYWLQACAYLLCHNEMFGTNIEKMIIMMGVENKLPLIFKRKVDDELILTLIKRIDAFYQKL